MNEAFTFTFVQLCDVQIQKVLFEDPLYISLDLSISYQAADLRFTDVSKSSSQKQQFELVYTISSFLTYQIKENKNKIQ